MKFWARLFSALAIAAVVAGVWVALAPPMRPPPVVAPVPAPVPTPVPAPVPAPLPNILPDGWRFPFPRLPLPTLPRPPERPAPQITSPVERILIEKSARRMTVWQADGPEQVFDIALGFAPTGDKSRQGDGRTPEGVFKVDRRNDRSAYHLSLGLDYPQARHRAAARAKGQDPGGDIMIHGQPNQLPDGTRLPGDWTAGCIAVTDAEINDLFAHTATGTEVEIRP